MTPKKPKPKPTTEARRLAQAGACGMLSRIDSLLGEIEARLEEVVKIGDKLKTRPDLRELITDSEQEMIGAVQDVAGGAAEDSGEAMRNAREVVMQIRQRIIRESV